MAATISRSSMAHTIFPTRSSWLANTPGWVRDQRYTGSGLGCETASSREAAEPPDPKSGVSAGARNGIQICTEVPAPGADLSIAWPPWAAAIACTIDRPRPLPVLPPAPTAAGARRASPGAAEESVERPGRLLLAHALARVGHLEHSAVAGPGQPHHDGVSPRVCSRTLPSRFASTCRIRDSSAATIRLAGAVA